MTGFESCKADGPGTAQGGQGDQLEKWKAEAAKDQNDKVSGNADSTGDHTSSMGRESENYY